MNQVDFLMNDGFETVFLITNEPYIKQPYLFGLLAFIVGILLLIYQYRKNKTGVNRYLRTFILIISGMGWFVINFNMQIDYKKSLDHFISLYENKEYEIVEGIVNVKYIGKKEGHDGGDVVIVDKRTFQLSHFVITPVYQESIVYGGLLTDGSYVRIYHLNGDILRIDKMNLKTNDATKKSDSN